MKKIMMGLVAVLATTFAVPAFAEEAPAADAKPAKAEKKGKKEKKPKTEAKPAEGGAK